MPKTEEQRKADARKRSQEYRDRKKAVAEAAKAKERDARDAAAGTEMRDAIESALKAMKWIQPSDAASVAQARQLAKSIDELAHEGDRIRMLSAHQALTRVLHELGGTPTVRMQHELRSLRAQTKNEVPDGSNDEASTAGNVSAFRRPPKRKRA